MPHYATSQATYDAVDHKTFTYKWTVERHPTIAIAHWFTVNTPNQLDGRTELQPHLFFRLYLADRIGHTYGIIPTQSTGESL